MASLSHKQMQDILDGTSFLTEAENAVNGASDAWNETLLTLTAQRITATDTDDNRQVMLLAALDMVGNNLTQLPHVISNMLHYLQSHAQLIDTMSSIQNSINVMMLNNQDPNHLSKLLDTEEGVNLRHDVVAGNLELSMSMLTAALRNLVVKETVDVTSSVERRMLHTADLVDELLPQYAKMSNLFSRLSGKDSSAVIEAAKHVAVLVLNVIKDARNSCTKNPGDHTAFRTILQVNSNAISDARSKLLNTKSCRSAITSEDVTIHCD